MMIAAAPKPAPRVLVVEDEALVREVVAVEFEEAGFSVFLAATGEEALDVLSSGQALDLLFTDIRLPGALDGWTLAERARDHRPDLPLIYASGYSPEPARKVSGSIFIAKPLRGPMILDAVRKLGFDSD